MQVLGVGGLPTLNFNGDCVCILFAFCTGTFLNAKYCMSTRKRSGGVSVCCRRVAFSNGRLWIHGLSRRQPQLRCRCIAFFIVISTDFGQLSFVFLLPCVYPLFVSGTQGIHISRT
jgi:hypothetical protein